MISDATAQLVADALDNLDGLVIPPMEQVDRATYDEFAEIVKRLRGKWKRGKGHVFEYDPAPALRAVIETRTMPDKNPLAYFPTPLKLSTELISLLSPNKRKRILEPSAGSGNLVEAARLLWPTADFVAVEADPINVAQLKARNWPLPDWWDAELFKLGNLEIKNQDFLTFDPSEKFDIVIMNPPFSVDGDPIAWVTHLRHAWSLLEEGGCLMCIAPAGTWETSTRKSFVALRKWLDEIGACTMHLGPGEFADAGTQIKTLAIYAYKIPDSEWTEPHSGYPSYYAWAGWLMIDSTQELQERERKLKLRKLDPNGAEFRELYVDAARQWNREGVYGIPITETYLEQMASSISTDDP